MKSLTILRPHARHPGIYAVLCARAGMVYIGQTSRAMIVRWDEHVKLLTLSRHPNTAMQTAWNAHGGAAFEVAILEVVTDAARLDARERYWIRRLGNANMKGR